MNYCETCKHWKQGTWGQGTFAKRDGVGECDNPKLLPLRAENDVCMIYTSDCYHINYHINTNPKFGCVLWESNGSDK